MTTTMEAPVPAFDVEDYEGRKLAIICSKGSLDMAYPGLVLANAALGEGVETHLFFTFWGFDIINRETMGHLQFTPLGNPATHMPPMLMGLPGMTAFATHMMKKQIEGIDVPGVPEFLEMITDAGGHLWACRMSADMMHLSEADLYERVEGIISASDFIEISEGAQPSSSERERLDRDSNHARRVPPVDVWVTCAPVRRGDRGWASTVT